MTEVALAAGALAALAVIALVVRAFFLVKRVQSVWQQVQRTVESELAPSLRAWGEAAQGVQQAARKLDGVLAGLDSIVQRLDRLSQRLDSGLLMGAAVTKVTAWLAGVRRGLQACQHKDSGKHSGALAEGQGEPGD